MTDDTEADLTNIDLLKGQVSIKTGVPADVLRGTTLDEIEEHAAALKPLLPEPRPAAGHIPTEGRVVNRPAPNPSSAFADFLNRALGHTR